jgi:hypothetical protein
MKKALIKALRRIIAPNGSNYGNIQIDFVCLTTSLRGLGIHLPKDILQIAYPYPASQLSTIPGQNSMFPSISLQPSTTVMALCP